MNDQELMIELKDILDSYQLNNVQEIVLYQSFIGSSYLEIAMNFDYEYNYIKEVGSKLWKLLSRRFKTKVSKKNLRAVIRKQHFAHLKILEDATYNFR